MSRRFITFWTPQRSLRARRSKLKPTGKLLVWYVASQSSRRYLIWLERRALTSNDRRRVGKSW